MSENRPSMTNPIENMARRLTATLRHHGVEMHPDDINGLGQDAILALADAGYAVVPASGTVDMAAAFWRQKNAGTQEVGENGPDTDDLSAIRAMIQAGRVTG